MMFESCLVVSDNKNVHCKVVMLILIKFAWYPAFGIALHQRHELLRQITNKTRNSKQTNSGVNVPKACSCLTRLKHNTFGDNER